jgi:hypothetical protein
MVGAFGVAMREASAAANAEPVRPGTCWSIAIGIVCWRVNALQRPIGSRAGATYGRRLPVGAERLASTYVDVLRSVGMRDLDKAQTAACEHRTNAMPAAAKFKRE